MTNPTDQAKLTAEERAKKFMSEQDYMWWDKYHSNYDDEMLELEIVTLLRQAEDAVRDAWMRATEHPATCGYINAPKNPCTCGAHAKIAELHAQAAKDIREGK